MPDVVIRLASERDRPALRQAFIALQEHERALTDTRLPGEAIAEAYLAWMTRQAEAGGGVHVAERAGDFAGFAAGWIEQDDAIAETEDSKRFGYVSDICVLPAFRRQGVATRLLEALTRQFAEAGVSRVRIGALANNAMARATYERAGFAPYEVVFEKPLPTPALAAQGRHPAKGASRLTWRPLAKPPEPMRRRRLARLGAAQEQYVESLVSHGSTFALAWQGAEAGYLVLSAGAQLVEFHLEDACLDLAERAVDELAGSLGFTRLLAQSFDPLMMHLGLGRARAPVTRGLCYRVLLDGVFEPRRDVDARAATRADIAELAALSDDFFDGESEIEAYMAAGGLFVYRNDDGRLLGAGVGKAVIEGGDDIDVGMVVAPGRRRRGYGAYILRHLKAHFLTRGQRPIAGCDIENIASQRALARAGFAAMHRLVEFDLGGG